MHTADPTETYAQDDTPPPRTCYETSRLAQVSANYPREGISRNLTLQALCYEIPRSKRLVARTVDRTHVDRIPRTPGPIAHAALH
jgi:hypothetical protein